MTKFEIFLCWYATGLLLSLYWPLKYRKNMQGMWGSFFAFWPVHGFFGPLAILTSYPI